MILNKCSGAPVPSLSPEAFMTNRHVWEEKLVRFAISFMVKDMATQWAERHVSAVPFLFLTWAGFKAPD
jgi:hypothetical protein